METSTTFVKALDNSAEQREKINFADGRRKDAVDVAATVEAVFGCKWSLRILGAIRAGTKRPGAIERALTA